MNSDAAERNGQGISPEIHLRRLTIDDALSLLDRYLDDAFMSGLAQVKIIHGKGGGALKDAVHDKLTSHPLVKSFRLGTYGEGENGVTIAYLASRY